MIEALWIFVAVAVLIAAAVIILAFVFGALAVASRADDIAGRDEEQS